MRRFLPLLCAAILAACGELKSPTTPGGPGEPIDPAATFGRVQSEVLTPTCATINCHDLIGQQQSLVLTPSRAHAAIVGRPSTEVASMLLVAPGNPDGSYLYRKVVGSGISGDRMPQGRPPLSDAQLRLVRDWIRRGAPND